MRERIFLDRGFRVRGHHEGALLPRQRFRVYRGHHEERFFLDRG